MDDNTIPFKLKSIALIFVNVTIISRRSSLSLDTLSTGGSSRNFYHIEEAGKQEQFLDLRNSINKGDL